MLGNENTNQQQKMNLHFLKSPRLLAEMIQYNEKNNFDAVMGFMGCIIGIREKFNKYKQREKEEEIINHHNSIINSFRQDDFILSHTNNKRRYYGQQ